MNEELKQTILTLFEEEELEIIDEGEWVSDYKWEHCDTIVTYEDKFYCVAQSRQGSYHTDYYYDDPYVYEVKPQQVTVTKWVAV
jgi:hypothetical protein